MRIRLIVFPAAHRLRGIREECDLRALHQWLGDMGNDVSENTLRNWQKKGKEYLDRMVVELKRIALEKVAVVNCGETWCKVRKYDRYKKCYMWVLVNKVECVVIFFYEYGPVGVTC